jgi:hypothetical protein
MGNLAVLLLVVVVLALSAAATADLSNWQIGFNVFGASHPYDYWANADRFGVDPLGTYKYDTRDAVHPAVGDPLRDISSSFKPSYYKEYQDRGYGWPPDAKHGPDLPIVGWPSTGLLKDTRAPIVAGDVPEYWRLNITAPGGIGETVSLVWFVNYYEGLECPLDGSLYVKILSNPDLVAAGIAGDFDLLGNGAGTFWTPYFPAFGLNYDEDGNPTGPVTHTWVIEAGVVPEPSTMIVMAGCLLGLGGLIRRRA